MKTPIYLDYQATTPLDPRVLEVMMPYLTEVFGNPASKSHPFGWAASEAVEKGRRQIADGVGASAKEIIFTSGATESDNLAIKGVAEFYAEKGKHIITSAIEHKAVLDTCRKLESKGYEVTYLPTGPSGIIEPEQVAEAIRPDTILVSIMHANNEVGTVNPIADIGTICREKGVFFHTDAAQSLGKLPINVEAMNVDLMSLSGHKVYGPKGIGALYVRRSRPRVRLVAQMDGGGHEFGMRSGTLNPAAIAGFGEAVEIAVREMAEENARLLRLRQRLLDGITSQLDEIFVNGNLERRLASNLNISFAYVEGEAMILGLKDLAVSSGSACTSASLEPSYVLKALGLEDELAHTSIRFGIGRFTTEEEIDFAIEKVVATVTRLRELSPLYEMVKEGIDLNSIQWAEGH
ncbi:MAG: IscS subfamily cysteine desulfurase [Alphaproteobacteria bacterium CG_4_10_14_0_2_um_filter_63_37]|nr:MAG: IscS subfamily cysteine desulfurase [Proteobacteria bacterium CG1_02_64_396]PJA25237.1 MAG: IscS subfamily cysteine desulfurase [Alphaproteobacteria bacterium CG_4_10_14_0_2_um_filter_63_37]